MLVAWRISPWFPFKCICMVVFRCFVLFCFVFGLDQIPLNSKCTFMLALFGLRHIISSQLIHLIYSSYVSGLIGLHFLAQLSSPDVHGHKQSVPIHETHNKAICTVRMVPGSTLCLVISIFFNQLKYRSYMSNAMKTLFQVPTSMPLLKLTHWGRVTYICVSQLTIIGSDNGLSPDRRQAIIWVNAGILLIRTLGTNFSENIIEIQTVSL